ncbi:MAG: amidohydrolase family protein [SAR202 cluster bacterium]|nr:amidohydrolase family protein [SAR202 cluster bacterium]
MEPESDFKILRAKRLIDGNGGPSLNNQSVLIKDSEIVAVGDTQDIKAPDGSSVEVLDFGDKTIMPGMVDAHTHHVGFGAGRVGDEVASYPDEVLTIQAAKNARRALLSGVTTIRENGPKNVTSLRLRDAINEGLTIGPRMHLCGRPVSIIGGHMGYFGTTPTGPNQCREAVRQLIKEGADYIKITATGGSTQTSLPLRPSFNLDELRSITDEAQKFGKLTAAHCSSTQGIANSLDAGVDMIIHCIFQEPDGSNNFREDIAEQIVAQQAYVNPTLHVFRSSIWKLMLKHEDQGLSTAEQIELDEMRRGFDERLEHCARLLKMGAKVITGSDSSWGNYLLGNTPYETECLVMAGMSDSNAVHSVTNDSAKSLNMDDLVGSIEPGKQADIIVIDGDPTKKITTLWNVSEVFLGGDKIERGSDESLSAVRQHRPVADPE